MNVPVIQRKSKHLRPIFIICTFLHVMIQYVWIRQNMIIRGALMCTNEKICFTNSILNDCNKSCKTLFSNYKKLVGDTWTNCSILYAQSYICDSLTKAFNDTNVIRVIDKMLKKQAFTDYCYENYIDEIISSIQEPISKFSGSYRSFEDCEIAILNLLIQIYGEPNNPNNELYIRYLKLNPKPISLESLQIRDKYIGKTTSLVNSSGRRGQDELRRVILKYDCRCKLCGVNLSNYLKVSHIKPWAPSNDSERLDIYNVFLLCSAHDNAFNDGDISFNDDGKIIISSKLDGFNKKLLNINEDIKIKLEEGHLEYLKYHRENILKK